MPDQTPTPSPTQVVHPWRTTLRTTLAVLVAAGIIAPQILAVVQDQLGVYIPASVMDCRRPDRRRQQRRPHPDHGDPAGQ